VIDYRDWQVPLGRRFRALKLWFVIRHFGLRGLREKVRGHVRMAQQFARWVDDDPQFERAAPAPLNLVTFRHRAGDTVTEQILAHVNATGRAYLTHTKLDDRFVIRLCVGQTNTQLRHVEQVWHLIRQTSGRRNVTNPSAIPRPFRPPSLPSLPVPSVKTRRQTPPHSPALPPGTG
jgi:aromatic-L-amino-acid/L-tryptophan decarboxylase